MILITLSRFMYSAFHLTLVMLLELFHLYLSNVKQEQIIPASVASVK